MPGFLNAEREWKFEKPGVYYGQCSELCGVRHAYMPIAVEALPMPQFLAWVRAQAEADLFGKNTDSAAGQK